MRFSHSGKMCECQKSIALEDMPFYGEINFTFPFYIFKPFLSANFLIDFIVRLPSSCEELAYIFYIHVYQIYIHFNGCKIECDTLYVCKVLNSRINLTCTIIKMPKMK